MYVKTLTLKGFKSFATPTTFEFEPGVTAIVGPNGSGKSNVVDALAWVMGEQGAKTLRGGRMEDVIFAGTAERAPLGRAEVVLTIDNTDGALPIDYTEVSIRRTLFRSGASEYAINGQTCRLLDVQELLSDTGLGREMHVIVGQGRLDDVLRASAVERREFVEEAAGILKHRRRKERTVRKLESMEANLARVKDLSNELRRQLKPLGAQAETARAAQQIQARVRDGRSRLLALDLAAALDARQQAQADAEQAEAQRQEAAAAATSAREGQQALEKASTSHAVEAAAQVAFDLQRSQQRAESLRDLAGQQVALLAAQAEAPVIEDELPDVAAQQALAADRTAAAAARESAWKQAQDETGRLAARLTEADRQLAARSELISRGELEASKLRTVAETAQERAARAVAELEAAEQAQQEGEARLADADAGERPVAATTPAEDVDGRYDQARRAAETARTDLEAARTARAEHEQARHAAEARAAALDLALTGRSDAERGPAALADRPGVLGLVAAAVHAQPGFEKAIAAALGVIGDAVLVESEDAAAQALAGARDAGVQAAVLVAEAAVGTDPEDAEPGDAEPSADRALADQSYHRALDVCDPVPALRPLLARVVVVDALPSVPLPDGLTAVTTAGELRRGALLVSPGEAAVSRVELASARDTAQAQAERAARAVAAAAMAVHAAEDAVHRARAAETEALAAVRARDAARAEQQRLAAQAAARAAAARAEIDRLQQATARRRAELKTAQDAAAAAAQALAAHAAQPAPLPLDIDRDALADQVRSARAREMEARIAYETAKHEAQEEARRTTAAQRRAQQIQEARDVARRAEQLRQQRLAAAREVLTALTPILASLSAATGEAQEQLGAARAEQERQTRALGEARQRAAAATTALAAATARLSSARLSAQQAELAVDNLTERARTELAVDVADLLREYGPAADGDDTPSPDDVRRDLQRAERELRRLGAVNPLALEQFAALEQRYTAMSEQVEDLQATKRELLGLIDELDQRMQGIFEAAFADTSAAFDRVLPLLFPGGKGALRLSDPDDPLGTGVDVELRPVGKNVDRLSLLSGGERSLAALAVLIAIFIARPSPFYIMDEVEAALDDANLGRLLTVFGQLREGSQLIVITHQKRTMEIADALYGVSMRRDGVSTVVGQRLAEREPPAPRDETATPAETETKEAAH
jgi:chromosome segregation protein